MNLLYLSGSYVPSRSASSVHVMKMCSALSALVTELELVTKHCASREEPGVADDHEFYGVGRTFTLTKLPRPAWRGGGLVFMSRLEHKLARTDGATLVYARDLVAAWQAVRRGFRVVYEAHGLPAGPLSRRLLRALVRSPRLARLVVISRALADRLLPLCDGAEGLDVVVAHDAADALPGDPPPRSPGPPRIGYVGHLYPGRGVEIVFEIARRCPDLEVHLVGGWPEDVARWKSAAPGPNTILHGFVPPREIPALYARFDILLMPYQRRVGVRSGRSDTAAWMSPMKMFEYMAAGRAIVSSDLPVLREILEDGRNALLVAPDEPQAWIDAIERLVHEEGLMQRLGEQARADLEERHTWSARAEKVLHGLR